jgi:hypothetical protein
MTKGYWQDALKRAQAELEEKRGEMQHLDEQRAMLAGEILQLEKAVDGLAPLASDRAIAERVNDFLIENATELGLADACREVLKKANRYMTAVDVRDALEAGGFDLSNYSNPLASIHGILKRFDESGEVASVSLGSKTSYKIAPPRRTRVPQQPNASLIQALEEDAKKNKK